MAHSVRFALPRVARNRERDCREGDGSQRRLLMSHPFQKVLCAVDFSPSTTLTIETARQIAEANKGTVILFHVVPMPFEAIGQPLMVEPLGGAEEDARRRLNRIASESLTHAYEILVVT